FASVIFTCCVRCSSCDRNDASFIGGSSAAWPSCRSSCRTPCQSRSASSRINTSDLVNQSSASRRNRKARRDRENRAVRCRSGMSAHHLHPAPPRLQVRMKQWDVAIAVWGEPGPTHLVVSSRDVAIFPLSNLWRGGG